MPIWDRRLSPADRLYLDTVVNPNCLSPYRPWRILLHPKNCGVGYTSDCIDAAQALLQDEAIEEYLRKTKVAWDLIGIEIMQRQHYGTGDRR